MNSYNQFITDIFIPLSGVYGDHFLGIDETFEEMPSGLTYCIRPSFNFGDSYQATNLREVENNIIVTFQIFKAHDSNADIVFIAEDIKERLLDYSIFKVNDYNFSIDVINFQKVYDSAYASIAVLIYATKTGKNIENPEPIEDALTFTSVLDGSTIKLSLIAGNVDESGLYYRFKNTGDWSKYTFDTEITLNKDKIVQFKNTNTSFNTNLNNYAKFIMTGLFKASGNCNSLINYSNTLINSTFISLFDGCDELLTSPKLPGTDIKGSAYYNMFKGCSRLLFAPDLPATTLPSQAYFHMFQNCRSLLYAPELPATTIGANTYDAMFYNCTNLLTAPTILPAETTFSQSYQNMFYACTKIKKAPILAANKIDYRTCYNMFNGCTSLTQAPELSATTLAANSCYQSMFQGCTSLSSAPELPATTLTNNCYQDMFNGCTSLTHAPALSATTLTNYCYYYMFANCESLTTAPDLPATQLFANCYQSMFYKCTALTGMANMAATNLFGATNCCNGMYNGCTSLTETHPLLTTNLSNVSAPYYAMFQGCTSLIKAPEIMATTIGSGQNLQSMFAGCTNLNYIKVHFTAWNSTGFTNWVNNVAASGTFICPGNLSIERGTNRIPNNWTVETDALRFIADEDNATVQLSGFGTIDLTGIKYRTLSSDWTAFNSSVSLNQGDIIEVKNTNNSLTTSTANYAQFVLNKKFNTDGNINSLINYSNISNNCFYNLFKDCSTLLSSPKLPATDLAASCYRFMFRGCTSLTEAPVLPALKVFQSSYAGMFYGCTSLTQAPELPASTLTASCYANMFEGCTRLVKGPSILPATTLFSNCYQTMFSGCTSLTQAPELPATTLVSYCYQYMFQNCTSLSSLTVGFTEWEPTGVTLATRDWVKGILTTGTFNCPSDLSEEHADNRIPNNWTVTRI